MNPTATPARLPLPHGYPPAAAYTHLTHDPLLEGMRRFDEDFLRANAEALRDYDARWGLRPFRHWSRRWEYPYVFSRLAEWDGVGGGAAGAAPKRTGLRVLDAGAGLTFFPHYLARELPVERVECTDRDPAMERDARRLGPPASPAVRYSTQDLAALQFPDESFDCAYSVSVLEHTTEWDRIIEELFRTLRPGGLLAVTIDVALDGGAEIPRAEAARLMAALERRFTPLDTYGTRVLEPGPDAITTRSVGRYEPSLVPPRTWASAGGVMRRMLRPWSFPWGRAFGRLIGGGPGGRSAPEISVFCAAFLKPERNAPPVRS